MRKSIILAVVALASVTVAMAQNEPPPVGAILDLNGLAIPTTGYQSYSVSFAAGVASTAITFALREDPAFLELTDIDVYDVTTSTDAGLLNGSFALGTVGTSDATDWTYANIYGATFGGVVEDVASGDCGATTCWWDGAVQAYDAISQNIATNIGDTYRISFMLADDGAAGTFSDLSTNGDITDTGGNGRDLLVYAQSGLPPPVPEPGSIVLLASAVLGVGGVLRRRLLTRS